MQHFFKNTTGSIPTGPHCQCEYKKTVFTPALDRFDTIYRHLHKVSYKSEFTTANNMQACEGCTPPDRKVILSSPVTVEEVLASSRPASCLGLGRAAG